MLKKRCRPWFDRPTMRMNVLKTLGLIPTLSKDEATIFILFQQPANRIRKAVDAS
jgi:hypothetical protein